jgi:hypothetical protein
MGRLSFRLLSTQYERLPYHAGCEETRWERASCSSVAKVRLSAAFRMPQLRKHAVDAACALRKLECVDKTGNGRGDCMAADMCAAPLQSPRHPYRYDR